jgi:uptake hydrogenase large subunit
MGAFDSGRVKLSLVVGAERIGAATVSCLRPDVVRILRGQPAGKAVALVPLIYSLCGKAQGVAARAALAAARGDTQGPHVDVEVLAEAAREHAWKLFIDWPKQLGVAPDEAFFVRLVRASPPERATIAATLPTHPLPTALRDGLGAGDIDGLLRHRIDTRLAELLDWLLDRPQLLGTVSAGSVAACGGEARVETARGTLIHRLMLDGDNVADYSITAPTDVHFAAGGSVSQRLAELRGLSKTDAERMAAHLVMAFDPCVPWEFEYR